MASVSIGHHSGHLVGRLCRPWEIVHRSYDRHPLLRLPDPCDVSLFFKRSHYHSLLGQCRSTTKSARQHSVPARSDTADASVALALADRGPGRGSPTVLQTFVVFHSKECIYKWCAWSTRTPMRIILANPTADRTWSGSQYP